MSRPKFFDAQSKFFFNLLIQEKKKQREKRKRKRKREREK